MPARDRVSTPIDDRHRQLSGREIATLPASMTPSAESGDLSAFSTFLQSVQGDYAESDGGHALTSGVANIEIISPNT